MPEYIPSNTGRRFHDDDTSMVKVLMSGVGMGKTVTLLHELFFRACAQLPNGEGVRRTRWIVVRASYSQLKSTTIRTFIEWFGHIATIVYDSPIRATIRVNLPDGTRLDTEFLFMSLDGDDAMDQLLSFEITGGAVNELAEIRSTKILKNLLQRCARFPPMSDGVKCTWHGVIGDMNPPPIGSWLYNLFKVDMPERHALYAYPSPITVERDINDPDDVNKVKYIPNPEAENVNNLPKGYDYWIDIARANIHDWDYVVRFVIGDFPFGGSGRPIYPMFSHSRHVKPEVSHLPGSVLMVGMDFGFKPAAAICQYHSGRLNLIEEIVTEDCSLTEFLDDHLIPLLRTKYMNYKVVICGDPSGDDGTSTIDRATSYQTLRKYNLRVYKPITNRFKPRREAVMDILTRREGFAVHPSCTIFIGGAASGYCWKEQKSGGHRQVPDKTNIYSHVQDAFQCVALYLKHGGEVYTQLGESADNFDMPQLPQSSEEAPGFMFV